MRAVFATFFTLLANLVSFIFIAPFVIYFAVISIFPVVIFFLFFWEWSFIGEKKLLISEQFETEGHIFQKMTELSFSPDAATQSVIVKLENPSLNFLKRPYIHEKVSELNFSYFWSKLFGTKISMDTIQTKKLDSIIAGKPPVEYTKEEKEYLKKFELHSKNLKILKDRFTPISQRLVSLDNCTVGSKKDWVCQDKLPFLLGLHSYIGVEENDFIIDYKDQNVKFSNHEFFDWKTLWWLQKKKCNNYCFIDTVENWNAKQEELDQLGRELIRQMYEEQNRKRREIEDSD